jgi:hypothetical protein
MAVFPLNISYLELNKWLYGARDFYVVWVFMALRVFMAFDVFMALGVFVAWGFLWRLGFLLLRISLLRIFIAWYFHCLVFYDIINTTACFAENSRDTGQNAFFQ